ncbi:site-specific integrase [Neomoorella mulderi]|uniref:Transposase n=1 Tax=Moorella mulderi DSM 14980 TaxID=1122241 RepID=A0A151AU13_9FIRM|nr:site-specific integrase [Moorella mulderi]KYH31125.1 transposase [Moorella mulderi DSM 14980]
MPKRRGNGEGTISKRKDGRWEGKVTIEYDPVNGKTKRLTFYGRTRQEVAEKITKALAEIQHGTFVKPTGETLGEWLDIWFANYVKPRVRPTTRDNYEATIRKHIKPYIGDQKLGQLLPSHLQALYNRKLAEGLSGRTVRLIHTVLHAALKQAVKEGLAVRNVAEATSPPRWEKKEMRVLSPEEQNRLLEALESHRLYAAFLLDMATGLRRGELLGLKWEDIDLKQGLIHVKRTLVRVKAENGPVKTALVFQEPKTAHGRRTIPIPESILPELKAHKKRQAQEKLIMGQNYQDNGLVFCGIDGRPLDPSSFGDHFAKLAKKAGIEEASMHTLRHTFATRLLELNEHPKIVQELLGHSTITMTLDTYSHVSPELKKQAAAKLDGLFKPKKKSSPT